MPRGRTPTSMQSVVSVSLGRCKILIYFEAFVHESVIYVWPAPTALLQYDCTSIAQYTTHRRPPFCMPCTIQHWQWQYRVKANVSLGHPAYGLTAHSSRSWVRGRPVNRPLARLATVPEEKHARGMGWCIVYVYVYITHCLLVVVLPRGIP